MDNNTNNCYNNIIWGNTSADVYDIRIFGSGTANSYHNNYSLKLGTWNYETGKTDLNPELSVNYHLKPNSPCIDTGYNPASSLPSTDIDGDDRVLDGNRDGIETVDIGADEYISGGIISRLLLLLLN